MYFTKINRAFNIFYKVVLAATSYGLVLTMQHIDCQMTAV